MRSSLVGGLTAVCVATATMAADMPPGVPPEAAPPLYRVYNWTGFYLGPNVAYGFANPTVTATRLGASAAASEKLNGALAGGQLGANWQAAPRRRGLGRLSPIAFSGSAQGAPGSDMPSIAYSSTLPVAGLLESTHRRQPSLR